MMLERTKSNHRKIGFQQYRQFNNSGLPGGGWRRSYGSQRINDRYRRRGRHPMQADMMEALMALEPLQMQDMAMILVAAATRFLWNGKAFRTPRPLARWWLWRHCWRCRWSIRDTGRLFRRHGSRRHANQISNNAGYSVAVNGPQYVTAKVEIDPPNPLKNKSLSITSVS